MFFFSDSLPRGKSGTFGEVNRSVDFLLSQRPGKTERLPKNSEEQRGIKSGKKVLSLL